VSQIVLDTNVISEISRKLPEPKVLAFLTREGDLWLSSLVIHELFFGAERLPDGPRKNELIERTSSVAAQFAGRIIPVAAKLAEIAGALRGHAARQGKTLQPIDSIMAATAISKDAFLATRNTKDFVDLGVSLIDPWAGAL
jgi:predicted nucleic acid-binding protein